MFRKMKFYQKTSIQNSSLIYSNGEPHSERGNAYQLKQSLSIINCQKHTHIPSQHQKLQQKTTSKNLPTEEFDFRQASVYIASI